MKTKTIKPRTPTNNSRTIIRNESNKKIQLLVDKLASHFKLRLSSLLAEKNYKYSNMVLDIGTFLRKLGNNNLKTESIIPKLEKHLLEILSKMPSDHSKYITEMSKINQILKTEVNNINTTNNGFNHNNINQLSVSLNNVPKTQQNILDRDVKGSLNLARNDALRNSLDENNSIKSLPNESYTKNIMIKQGAHLAINPNIPIKFDINRKHQKANKANSKKNIINIPNNKVNNADKNSVVIKSETFNNLIPENNANKNAIASKNAKNNLITNENYYPTNNTSDGLNKNNEILNTNGTRSNLTNNLNNINNSSLAKEAGLSLIQKTEKLNDLREKAMDEWAMIVKYNHLKHLEEEQNRKNIEEDKKRKVREILENQMKEKDHLKKLKQEEDKKFFKMQTEKIENMEKDNIEKEKKRLDKIKQQKETQEKLIKEHQEHKNEMKIKDKIKDKMILEKIRHDLMTEEEKLSAKKQNEREMYLNIIKENEQKAELKKKAKEIEKLENKKALEEYSNLIEKQERERLINLQNKIVKSNNNFEIQNQKARKQEELLKQIEEQRFLKEKEEIELKKKQQEENTQFKKQKQIDEIKNALKNQIDEKKRIGFINQLEDQKYNELVKNNTKKYFDEKESQIKTNQSKVVGYKELLDQQLNEKGTRKYKMDEKEKQFNKDLIGKVYSELVQ